MIIFLLHRHHIPDQPTQFPPMPRGFLGLNLQGQPTIQRELVGRLLYQPRKTPVQSPPCHQCPISYRTIRIGCHCYHAQAPVAQDHPRLLHRPYRPHPGFINSFISLRLRSNNSFPICIKLSSVTRQPTQTSTQCSSQEGTNNRETCGAESIPEA